MPLKRSTVLNTSLVVPNTTSRSETPSTHLKTRKTPIVRPLPVAILAGGLGTRLYPLTKHTPKAMLPIHGVPFIIHQLRLLHSRGIKHVVLCVGHFGDQIYDFVGDGSAFGLKVEYSWDGGQERGTAGALRKALPKFGRAFFVLYGDSYLPCDYLAVQEAFLSSGKPALMTVFRNDGQWDDSNVQFEQGQIWAYSKLHRTQHMHYIDYGLGVFKSSIFATLPEGERWDLVEVYQPLLARKELAAFEAQERFYEVGSVDGRRTLHEFLLGQNDD